MILTGLCIDEPLLRMQVWVHKPPLPFEWGTHHSKMMLLAYRHGGLRVVVFTANLVFPDCNDKTQGLWYQVCNSAMTAPERVRPSNTAGICGVHLLPGCACAVLAWCCEHSHTAVRLHSVGICKFT